MTIQKSPQPSNPGYAQVQQINARFTVLPIATRLFIAFGLLLLLQSAITTVAFIRINAIKATGKEMLEPVSESLALQEIETAFYQGFEAECGYVGMKEAEAPQEMADAEKAWNAALAELDKYELDETEQANRDHLKTLLGQASAAFKRSVELVDAGDMRAAQDNHTRTLDPIVAEITTLFEEAIQPGILTDTQAAKTASDRAADTSLTWIVLLGAAALLVGLASSMGVGYSVSEPIRKLTRFAQEIADGNLEVEPLKPTNDDIGLLARVFNHMVENLRGLIHKEQAQQDYL